MYVKDVKDRSNTPKGCNAMYVRDVEDRSNTPKGCNAMYVGDVEDVKDGSNTPKGCNAMYVEDKVKMGVNEWLPHYLIRSRSHCNSNFNSKWVVVQRNNPK